MKGVFARGLWTNADFTRLWTGQSISMVGSQMTLLALPLTAVLVLHATPSEMGALAALEYAPFLVVGLIAGAYVDRLAARHPKLQIVSAHGSWPWVNEILGVAYRRTNVWVSPDM